MAETWRERRRRNENKWENKQWWVRQSLNVGKKAKSREESCKARLRKEVTLIAPSSREFSLFPTLWSYFSSFMVPNPQPEGGVRCQWQRITSRNQLQVTIMKILNQTFTWLCPWAVRWQPERKMEVTGQMQRLRGNPYQTEYYKTILKVNYGDQIEISTYVKHIIS